MTVAAVVLTAITAGAALWTVRLSYKAIGLAKEAAISADESATAGERAAVAAEKTAEEVRLGRTRDRLESERHRFHDLIELVEELQIRQRVVIDVSDFRWIEKRNLLASKLSGSEGTFPETASVVFATSPMAARLGDARAELNQALLAIETRIHEHDFG